MRRKVLPIPLMILALALVVLIAITVSVSAQTPDNQPETTDSEVNPYDIYIIRLQGDSLATYRGGITGLPATSPKATGSRKLDVNTPRSRAYLDFLSEQHLQFVETAEKRLGREVVMLAEHNVVGNSVAFELSTEEAELVASMPQVRQVTRNFKRQLHTDNGPAWIGASSMWGAPNSCLPEGQCGEGVIIGIIDTGINGDHPSFADIGGDGYDHTNPNGSGNYKGYCVANPGYCNDKLIGAWDFRQTSSPEDADGHGSHTASTAGGNFLYDVTLNAPTIQFQRDISGVAPHANIIAYNACCFFFDLLSAIDQAVTDGVDVINYSIGGASSDPWSDTDAQYFLDAREAGVFVATSAGNSGPGASTLGSPGDAPWLLTVGASTHNRAFLNSIVNATTDQGSTLPQIDGRSVTDGYGPAPAVYAGDHGNTLCEAGIWSSSEFSGEIVICDRGSNARVEKSQNAADAGAGGMILANDAANGYGLSGDSHPIPSVHISYVDGVTLKNWLANGDSGHVATIVGTSIEIGSQYADKMASFSSRGPNPASLRVLKPDITGPGVDILAAVHSDGRPQPEIDVMSGTSMSSPHLAGAAALVVQAQPSWSPAEIQSAIMSTAKSTEQFKSDGVTPAEPFDLGAGRVDLSVAAEAGFVLDETKANYDASDPGSGGDPSALNHASLAYDQCNGSCTWTRTLESTQAGDWTASSAAPAGLAVNISPSSFSFTAAGETQIITIEAHPFGLATSDWAFAQVDFRETGAAAPDAHFPLAISSTCAPPTAPTADISDSGNDAVLTWSNEGASAYEVWRSVTPYFTPASSGSVKRTPDNYTLLTFTDTGVLGTGQSYYYKVISRSNCDACSADDANHTGAFDFTLIPGSL